MQQQELWSCSFITFVNCKFTSWSKDTFGIQYNTIQYIMWYLMKYKILVLVQLPILFIPVPRFRYLFRGPIVTYLKLWLRHSEVCKHWKQPTTKTNSFLSTEYFYSYINRLSLFLKCSHLYEPWQWENTNIVSWPLSWAEMQEGNQSKEQHAHSVCCRNY